jgi:hypothetical protein
LIEGRLGFPTFFLAVLVLITLWNAALSLFFAWLLNKIGPSLADKRWGRYLLIGLCVLVLPFLVSGFGGAAAFFILMIRQTIGEHRYRADWAC